MKKQNLFKSIFALSVVLCMLICNVTAFAATSVTMPVADGYTFLNAAYSPETDTYLAVAKNLSDANTPIKVFASSNGYSWLETKTFSSAKTGQASTSTQILTYWASQKVFVLAVANVAYYSADGSSWTQLRSFGNSIVMTANETQLFFGWYDKAAVYDSLSSYQDVSLSSNQWVSRIVCAQNGCLAIQKDTTYGGYRWYISKTDDTYSAVRFNNIKDDYGSSATYLPYCGKSIIEYVDKADIKLITAETGAYTPLSITLSDGTINESVITATGYANNKTYLGTADGKIYYTTQNTELTAETVWEVAGNSSATNEKIVAFSQGKDGKAIVLSEKNIFTLENNAYKNINEYSAIATPTVKKANIFDGVRLFGGAYAEGKGYIVYGNNSAGKGVVYKSADGINWNNVLTTPVLFNTRSNGAIVPGDNCVYWENKGLFVISIGGIAQGTCWYSFNGSTWFFSQTIPTSSPTGSIDLGLDSNLAVSGDYLYTADPSTKQSYFKTTFTVATNEESGMPEVTGHKTDKITGTVENYGYAFSRIAVSDETEPTVFLNGGYGVAMSHVTASDTFSARTGFINGGNGTTLMAIKWDNNLEKFVGVRTDAAKYYIFGSDMNPKSSTALIAETTLVSFDNNGTNYVFGASNGSLASVKSAELDTATSFTNISGEENTLPVTSVIKGIDKKFIVTVSDETDSDILIVNADATSYEKASSKATVIVNAGESILITANAINNSETAIPFKMITAIYDGNKLVQVQMSDKSITAHTNGNITEEMTFSDSVNSNCTMRVYMWDASNDMKPVMNATPFFE